MTTTNLPINHNSAKNQEIKSRLVDREVIYCVSHLVSELAQKAEHFRDYEDDLYGAFQGEPDYQEAAEAEGWEQSPSAEGWFFKPDNRFHAWCEVQEFGTLTRLRVYRQEHPLQAEAGELVWQFIGNDDQVASLLGYDPGARNVSDYLRRIGVAKRHQEWQVEEDLFDWFTEDVYSELTWQELCSEENIDTSDFTPEVFEHWLVSGWFADKLEEHGEKVLRDFFGLTVWCRCTTGQAIMLDEVISQIAEEMEILEGQKNEW